MPNNSIWVLSNAGEMSTRPMFDYIQQQGAELSRITQGKLTAALYRVAVPWVETLQTVAAALTGPADGIYHAKLHKGSKDASELYKKHTYEFLIVDAAHKYELSLFQVTCNDTFPVTLMIDPTIADESSLDSKAEVDSLDEFCDLFNGIVHSRKVVYVIDRLLHLPDEPEETTEQEEHIEDEAPDNQDQ